MRKSFDRARLRAAAEVSKVDRAIELLAGWFVPSIMRPGAPGLPPDADGCEDIGRALEALDMHDEADVALTRADELRGQQ